MLGNSTKDEDNISVQSSIISQAENKGQELENMYWQNEVERNIQKDHNFRFHQEKNYINFKTLDQQKFKFTLELENFNNEDNNNKNSSQKISFSGNEEDGEKKAGSMENGLMTRFYFMRTQKLEITCLVFGVTSIFLTILYFSIDSDIINDKIKDETSLVIIDACLWLQFISNMLTIPIVYFRYSSLLELEKQQKEIQEWSTLVSAGKLKFIFIETFILLLQPYPFINDVVFEGNDFTDYDGEAFTFKVNWILTLLGFIKMYIIGRCMLKQTKFMSNRAFRLCKMYSCTTNSYQYAIKCLFQDYPIPLISTAFCISVFFLAFMIKIAEKPVMAAVEDVAGSSKNFDDIVNCVWLVIITMTTVGYGDYFPRTLIGRTLVTMIAIWGNFLLSMLVITLMNTVSMEKPEEKSQLIINRLQIRKIVRQAAACIITSLARQKFFWQKMKKKYKVKQYMSLINSHEYNELMAIKKQTYEYASEFKHRNRQVKNMFEKNNFFEEMSRQFDYLQKFLVDIKDSQSEFCDKFQQKLDQPQGDDGIDNLFGDKKVMSSKTFISKLKEYEHEFQDNQQQIIDENERDMLEHEEFLHQDNIFQHINFSPHSILKEI